MAVPGIWGAGRRRAPATELCGGQAGAGWKERDRQQRAQAQACVPQSRQAAVSPLPNPSTQTLPNRPTSSSALPRISTAWRGEVGGGGGGYASSSSQPQHRAPSEFLGTEGPSPGSGGRCDPLWLENISSYATQPSPDNPPNAQLGSPLAALPVGLQARLPPRPIPALAEADPWPGVFLPSQALAPRRLVRPLRGPAGLANTV